MYDTIYYIYFSLQNALRNTLEKNQILYKQNVISMGVCTQMSVCERFWKLEALISLFWKALDFTRSEQELSNKEKNCECTEGTHICYAAVHTAIQKQHEEGHANNITLVFGWDFR